MLDAIKRAVGTFANKEEWSALMKMQWQKIGLGKEVQKNILPYINQCKIN